MASRSASSSSPSSAKLTSIPVSFASLPSCFSALTRPRSSDIEFLPEFFPPAPSPTTTTTADSSSSDPPVRPGPAPIEIEPTPPSAGADSSDLLVEGNSVKDESTTAISMDEGSKKPVGLPKELASVKLGSEIEENSVEAVMPDLPVEEK